MVPSDGNQTHFPPAELVWLLDISRSILFPEMCAIARACAGTHVSKFTCAIYRTRKIIVLPLREKFFIEGFSIEHNQL